MNSTRLTLTLGLVLAACGPEPEPTDESGPYVTDAQYICDTLTACFALELGPRCAADLEATTTAADIAQCADCYESASCEDIGEPGVPGTCDVACHNALFGVAQ